MVSAVTQFSTHNARVRRMGGGGGRKEVVWSRKPIFSWSNNTKVNFGSIRRARELFGPTAPQKSGVKRSSTRKGVEFKADMSLGSSWGDKSWI